MHEELLQVDRLGNLSHLKGVEYFLDTRCDELLVALDLRQIIENIIQRH